MSKISIIGSGGWGSAMAIMLAQNGHDVTLWSYLTEECENLKKYRENKPFLPGVKFPENVRFTDDIACCAGADITVMATPSHGVRSTARAMAPHIADGQIVVNISKGIEEGTSLTLSRVIKEEVPNCVVAVMSGPSHAEEVSRGVPTTNVVACEDMTVAEYVQDAFMNPNFRIYTNPDVLGVELGGSLKNVIALCAGILDGMGLGDNTKAALMTRGLVEMARLGEAMGAKTETFSGLSGLGDMIVTCTSMHSRNRRAGILIGQGKTADEAKEEVKMVVEGVRTCSAAKELADKYGVEMPIVNEAHKVLFENYPAAEALKNLMGRAKKHESERAFLYPEKN